jgi:sodium/bile acid cotransporter 7
MIKNIITANAFVAWIFGLVLLAWAFPELGGPDSIIPVTLVRKIGVFLIFFNQGVQLPGEALKKGILEWKLHLLVQLCTFVLFPVLVGAALWSASSFFDQPDLRIGFFYLAFLPTTVTSAVALTSVAEGNVTGALFNCTLSSVIGVFLVPFLCVTFLGAGGSEGQVPLSGLLLSIAVTILLPMVLGQIVRPFLKELFARHKIFFRRCNNGVILFIVWGAFCQSFLRNVWSQVSTTDLAMTVILGVVLLLFVSGVVWKASAWVGLEPESRISAFYCGSQKTLAMGLPMSALIFGTVEGVELSLLLIPLLVYHPAQLILGGLLAPVLSLRRSERP